MSAKKVKHKQSILHTKLNPVGVFVLLVVSVGLIYALVLSNQNTEVMTDASVSGDTWVAGLEISTLILEGNNIRIKALVTPHPDDLPIKKVDFYYRKINADGSFGGWVLISTSNSQNRVQQVERNLSYFKGLPGTFQFTANVYYGRNLPCTGNPTYRGTNFERCGGSKTFSNLQLGTILPTRPPTPGESKLTPTPYKTPTSRPTPTIYYPPTRPPTPTPA